MLASTPSRLHQLPKRSDYDSADDLDYTPDLSEESEDVSELSEDDTDFAPEKDLPESKNLSVSDTELDSKPPAPILSAHARFGAFISKHEIPRKALHVLIGFFTLWCYTRHMDTKIFIPYLSSAFAVIFSLDLLRFQWDAFNKAYCATVGFLMREKEVSSYNGVNWYLLGLSIAFQLFLKDVGVMAVLLLSWSDTAALTVGRAYGHLSPRIARNKSLIGSFAAFVVGIISCWVFYGYFVPTYGYTENIMWTEETSKLSLTTYSIACGFIAALSEGIDILNWDDNFTIPTLSGIFLHFLVRSVAK